MADKEKEKSPKTAKIKWHDLFAAYAAPSNKYAAPSKPWGSTTVSDHAPASKPLIHIREFLFQKT